MGDHYVGHTLADFLGFVSNGTATYQECAETQKGTAHHQADYCYRLIKAVKQLEEMTRQ